jgi:hypothetical protein
MAIPDRASGPAFSIRKRADEISVVEAGLGDGADELNEGTRSAVHLRRVSLDASFDAT